MLAKSGSYKAAPNTPFGQVYDCMLRVASEGAQGRTGPILQRCTFRQCTEYEWHLQRNSNTKGNIIEALVMALCERGLHMLSWTMLCICFHLANWTAHSTHPHLMPVI